MRKYPSLTPALILILTLGAATALSGCAAKITDATLKDRIRQAVREDPSIVTEALAQDKVALLEMVEQGARDRRAQATLDTWRREAANPRHPAIDEARPMRGDKDAPVTVVAYTDFQCGYCARGAKTIETLQDKYPGRLRYVAKHAPISETGEYAARVFEAVGLQNPGTAWEFYSKAFEAQGEISASEDPKAAFLALAEGLPGIDPERLRADMDGETTKIRVRDDAREYQGWNFRGVPVYLFNGVAVEGAMPLASLEQLLNILAETTTTSDAYSLDDTGTCTDCLKQ